MEIFIHRIPNGFITKDLRNLKELAKALNQYGPLDEDSEVQIEIKATWHEIRELINILTEFGKPVWKARW